MFEVPPVTVSLPSHDCNEQLAQIADHCMPLCSYDCDISCQLPTGKISGETGKKSELAVNTRFSFNDSHGPYLTMIKDTSRTVVAKQHDHVTLYFMITLPGNKNFSPNYCG